ncbi:Uncharacterised protein [Bordetella pertussis]|nr:Uncharacterised protein [Bordetella pertussis]CFW20905.1 Uncharacterised protein [Bordetella pertussis]
MHTWPALRNAALAIRGTAASRSASAQTMVLAMLPSSICVRRNPAARWMMRPTRVLPVNV